MQPSSERDPGILASIQEFWAERRARAGVFQATRDLSAALWEFLRDSTPSRLRSRFGDADYDWDYRVNTTSGAVGWRDRLLGVLHSPYQPTEPGLFHEMIDAFIEQTRADLSAFTFVDLGSGKGRTLLMAADYPFRQIIGVELLRSLHQTAEQNLAQYQSNSQRCFQLKSVCADATAYALPEGGLLIYLFNPFPETGLRRTLENLKRNLKVSPRPAYLLYHNPQLEKLLVDSGFLEKIAGTHQYSIFATTGDND